MATLALLMDPIAAIKPQKDSSLAMALATQARGWTLQYPEMNDLYLRNGPACAHLRRLAEHNGIIKPMDGIERKLNA